MLNNQKIWKTIPDEDGIGSIIDYQRELIKYFDESCVVRFGPSPLDESYPSVRLYKVREGRIQNLIIVFEFKILEELGSMVCDINEKNTLLLEEFEKTGDKSIINWGTEL